MPSSEISGFQSTLFFTEEKNALNSLMFVKIGGDLNQASVLCIKFLAKDKWRAFPGLMMEVLDFLWLPIDLIKNKNISSEIFTVLLKEGPSTTLEACLE